MALFPDHCLESQRLVVWISTGILGFQGVTLCFDLLNCTALSWVYVRSVGFQASVVRAQVAAAAPANGSGNAAPAAGPMPNPLNLFCERPHGRIDGAVSQGLSILAWPWVARWVTGGRGSREIGAIRTV
jgi:hypothetical protein